VIASSHHYRVARLSEWLRIKSSYQRGQEVVATVVKVFGHSLVCRVGGLNGPPAIVRKTELSWNKAEQRTDAYEVCQTFTAMVVEYGEDHRELVLSKKRTGAPLATLFKIGTEYSGTIIELHSWGFSVHLQAGIDGFLLKDEAPDDRELPSTVRLQVGDRVRVEIIGFDDQQGNPRLSMRCAIATHQKTIREEIEQVTAQAPLVIRAARTELLPGAGRAAQSLHILVLDDTVSVNRGITAYLESVGHRVTAVRTTEECRKCLAGVERLNTVLLDIQLERESIRNAELPIYIRTLFPKCRVYLFTGNETLLTSEDLTNLKDYVDGVIPKVWEPSLILDVIQGGAQAVTIGKLLLKCSQKERPRIRGFVGDSAEQIVRRAVDRHIGMLGKLWKDSHILVAEYDPQTTHLHKVNGHRFDSRALEGTGKQFLDSELGVVLKDGIAINLPAEERHPHPVIREIYRDLGSSQAVGFPVLIEGYRRNLAVFVFDSREAPMPCNFHADMDRALSKLVLEVEKELLQTRIFTFQRAAGTGALVLGMTHELRNLVSPVRTEIATVIGCLEDKAKAAALPPDFAKQAARRARDAAAAMASVMETLLGMTKIDEQTEYPLNSMLREVVELCRDSARQYDVHLILKLTGSEEEEMTMPAAMRQVFMNVILNGIQHVDQTRLDPATHLEHKLVSITVRPVNRERRLRIDVTDNGYGVATSQKATMFDMFVTTRPAGTGLGLFIARETLSHVEGEIRLKTDSHRYRDNTFSIILPAPEPPRP